MKSFTDFLMWYNSKVVVPTLEAMLKMVEFYHQKEIDMLNLGFTLSPLANICLYKPTDSKFYPFTENDKDLLEKIREGTFGGPSIVFTREAVVDEIFIRITTNLCKSIVGIDASHLYRFPMCQPMATGLYTRWNYDIDSQCLDKTKHALSKIWSFHIFNKIVRNVRLKAMLQLVDKRRVIALVLMGFVTIVTLSLKQWVVISTTVYFKKLARH